MLNLPYAFHQLLCGRSLGGRYYCHWPWMTRKLRFGQVKQFSQDHFESLCSQCELLLLIPLSYIFSLPPSEFFPSRNNLPSQLFMNSTNVFESFFYTRLSTTFKGSSDKWGISHRTFVLSFKKLSHCANFIHEYNESRWHLSPTFSL